MRHVCRVEDGWPGIAANLALARPGDTVRVSAGVFSGSDTLVVPSGVALQGEDGARLEFSGDGPAIMSCDTADIVIEGLAIVSLARNIGKRVLPWSAPIAADDDAMTEWGLVFLNGCRDTRIARLELTGQRDEEWLRGIAIRSGSAVLVERCAISEFGGSGISLLSSQGCELQGNRVAACANGIVLGRSPSSPSVASSAVLRGNRCHDNRWAGIVLFSSCSEAVEDNECWGNMTGISLQRDSDAPDQPSRAVLRGNRCHDNRQAGIVLFSSCSDAIEENQCWGNHTGIVLQRDPKFPDQPSRAVLRGNRCHGNRQSSILLISCESDAIEDNECWENGLYGIVLQRDSDAPDQPSRAVLRGNRCHDNGKAGIILFSSESDAIEDNECWGNKFHGISLERDSDAPDQPSRAVLRGNRCHDNGGAGIVLFSSESDAIEDNECWGNGTSGIALDRGSNTADPPSRAVLHGNLLYDNSHAGLVAEPDSLAGMRGNRVWGNAGASTIRLADGAGFRAPRIDELASGADRSQTEIVARQRSRSPGGSVAERLDRAATKDPDALAGFVAGDGCAGCLVRYRNVVETPVPEGAVDAPDVPAFRFDRAEANGRIVFRRDPVQGSGVSATFWRLVNDATIGRTRTAVLGVVSGDDGPVEGLLGEIATVEAARTSGDVAVADLRGGLQSLLRNMQLSGSSIATPVPVDYAPRSAAAMAGAVPAHALLEEALVTDRPVWRERLLQYLLGPAPLAHVAFLAGLTASFVGFAFAKGFDGPATDVLAALGFFVSTISIQFWDIGAIAGSVIAAPLVLLRLTNLFYPSRLRFWDDWINDRVTNWPLVGSRLALPERPKGPWRRWIRRRLFGGLTRPTVSVIVIRHPDQWLDEDAEALRSIAEMRRADQSLFILVQLQSASQIASGLVAPWFVDGDKLALSPGDTLDLLMLAPEAPLDVDRPPEVMPDAARTFGIEDLDEEQRRNVHAGIRDDRWSLADVLPMLVLGSTPASPMRLSRYAETSVSENFAPQLVAELQPYARFISGDAELTPSIGGSADLDRLHRSLTAAPSVLLLRRQERRGRGIRDLFDYVGRSAYRQAMAEALGHVLAGDDQLRRAYIWTMVACGELFNLLRLLDVLKRPLADVEAVSLVERHLQAALQLKEERGAFRLEDGQERVLEAHWKAVMAAFETIAPPEDTAARRFAVHVLAQLLTLCDGERFARPPLALAIAESATVPANLQEALEGEIARHLATLAELDRRYARDLLNRQFETSWARWADWLKTRIAEFVEQDDRFGKTLAGMLCSATDARRMGRAFRLHAEIGPEVLGVSYLLAARAARDEEAQLRLAGIMDRHRSAGRPIAGKDEIVRFHDPKDGFDAGLLDAALEEARRDAPEPAAFEHRSDYLVMRSYGSFAPVNATLERIVEIALE
jgi:nitrous oxidase accessory protein NosD